MLLIKGSSQRSNSILSSNTMQKNNNKQTKKHAPIRLSTRHSDYKQTNTHNLIRTLRFTWAKNKTTMVAVSITDVSIAD